MSFLPIKIPPGVVRGASPNDTPGRWYDTNLIRWRGGVMEPIGGWQRASETAFSDRVRRIHRYRNNNAKLRLLVLTDSEVRAFSADNGWVDVSPTSLATLGSGTVLPVGYGVGLYGDSTYGTPRATGSELYNAVVPMWSLDNWGEDVLAVNSSDGRLLLYDDSAPETAMTVVSGAPTGNRAVLVTEERHAMLLQEAGNARRLAWCSREDFTDWNYASSTNTAGYLDLEAETPLYTAQKVRNGVLVFSETEVFHVRYVGQPFVYGADFLESTRLIGPRAVAADSGVAFWWSKDGFFASDGSQVRPIPCPVWDYLCVVRCTAQAPSKLFASSHGIYPEIWWFYPSKGSDVADRYVVYNYLENWWAIGELSREAMCPALAGQTPMMAGTDHYLYEHERGWSDTTGTPRDGNIYAETSVLNVPVAGERNFEIRQAMAANDFGTDSLRMTFFTKQTPMGSERTFGPYSPRSDGYVDTRVTGRDVRIKVEALGDSDWNLGEIRLDVAAGARR